MSLQLIKTATVSELVNAANLLKAHSVKLGKLQDPDKVFPQLNSEKSCFAFAVLKQFGGNAVLTDEQKKVAGELASYYKGGMRRLFAEAITLDAGLRLAVQSDAWNSPTFFYKSDVQIVEGNETYILAFSRKNVTGVGLTTNICFIPQASKPANVEPETADEAVDALAAKF